jgi:NAD(P)-dependent dehydrogenase (short-subunit alcohol dehydrogenase family)
MRSVVITGVSTGIGWGTAKVLIASGFRVFGSVRSETNAERLSAEFGPNFKPLVFDVTEQDVHAAAKEVEAASTQARRWRVLSTMPESTSLAPCSTLASTSSSVSSQSTLWAP